MFFFFFFRCRPELSNLLPACAPTSHVTSWSGSLSLSPFCVARFFGIGSDVCGPLRQSSQGSRHWVHSSRPTVEVCCGKTRTGSCRADSHIQSWNQSRSRTSSPDRQDSHRLSRASLSWANIDIAFAIAVSTHKMETGFSRFPLSISALPCPMSLAEQQYDFPRDNHPQSSSSSSSSSPSPSPSPSTSTPASTHPHSQHQHPLCQTGKIQQQPSKKPTDKSDHTTITNTWKTTHQDQASHAGKSSPGRVSTPSISKHNSQKETQKAKVKTDRSEREPAWQEEQKGVSRNGEG